MGGGALGDGIAGLGDGVGQFLVGRLVGLGDDDLVADGRLVELVHHRLVVGVRAVAAIDQHVDAAQVRAAGEILVDQPGPLLHLRLGRLGETVAGHVDDAEWRVEALEDVELLRPPRRVGGAGKAGRAGQRVDEARFADIRAAGEGDFHPVGVRQVAEAHRSLDESERPREQQASRFDLGFVELGRVGHLAVLGEGAAKG